jgi:hypothetical protein
MTKMKTMKKAGMTTRATTVEMAIQNKVGCPRFAPFFGANLG